MDTLTRQRRLHREQARFLRSNALYRGFVGGRGSGKSWVISYDLLRRAKPDRLYMMVSPTYTILADTDFRAFCGIARDCMMLGEKKQSPPQVVLANGAQILFRSADDPERLRGPNLSGVALNEASLMHRDAYDICIASLREGGEQGWLTAGFTPKGFGHWTYDIFGSDPPRQNTAIFRASTKDNPFLPAGFQATLEGQYTGLRAAQELHGQFCNIEGAEWPPEYFDGIHFDEWPPDIHLRVLALDPSKGKQDKTGDYSAFVMLGLDNDWRLWVDADLDNTRPVEASHGGHSIVEDGLELVRTFRPDAFSIETNGFQELVAGAFLRVSRERNIHLPLYGVCSTTPKEARIRGIGTYLAQRRLRVKNTKGGRQLVQQMRDFGPKPAVSADDAPDALAQALRTMDYLVSGNAEGANAPQVYGGR